MTLLGRMYSPVDGSSIAVFRIGFGTVLLWEVWRYFHNQWIESYYTGKSLYFTYPYFSWVHPWPTLQLMEWHFLFLGLCSALVAIGLFYRIASVGLFFAFSYIFLLEQAHYLNHFYFVILVAFSMMFIPAHRTWSLDAYFWPHPRTKNIELWSIWLIRLQFGITYFYGGLAKFNIDWLRGYPLTDWIARDGYGRTTALFLSYSGILLDLLFVPLLLWRRTRWIGFFLAVAFNIVNSQLFHIGIFPWLMIVGTLSFFDADWPRKLVKRQSVLTKEVLQNMTTTQRIFAVFLSLFTAFQLLFPLRHILYPGVVHWTEEGHMFSWHMKLRSKSGHVEFVVKDPASDTTWLVAPREFLSSRQESKMSARPDMILFFAHWLHNYYFEREGITTEVYADSFASLNGRTMQRLVDPSVNLAAVEWSWRPSSWIIPLERRR